MLAQLIHRLGWALSKITLRWHRAHPKIIGQGGFASGIGDLALNKEHLNGFGS